MWQQARGYCGRDAHFVADTANLKIPGSFAAMYQFGKVRLSPAGSVGLRRAVKLTPTTMPFCQSAWQTRPIAEERIRKLNVSGSSTGALTQAPLSEMSMTSQRSERPSASKIVPGTPALWRMNLRAIAGSQWLLHGEHSTAGLFNKIDIDTPPGFGRSVGTFRCPRKSGGYLKLIAIGNSSSRLICRLVLPRLQALFLSAGLLKVAALHAG